MQKDTEHVHDFTSLDQWCECLDLPLLGAECAACNAEPGEPCRPGCLGYYVERGEVSV